MPVHHLVENRTQLLVFHFFGDVAYQQVAEAAQAIAQSSKPAATYRSLLVFDGSTDLSKIGRQELQAIKSIMNTTHDEASMQRPAGAIVIDGSLDAGIIMPLWKAICDEDTETEIHYRFFIEVTPALAWLDVLETPTLRRMLARPQ
jgi:hypothetical protein